MTSLNDQLFSDSEYAYNHKLAQKSLELAISAFSSEESMNHWGQNENCGREADVKNTLTEYGFSDMEFYNYNTSLNDSSSKAAFAVGKKIYNSDTVLIAIVIRGGRYGLEWADNFNIGGNDVDYHKGFYDAALKIKEQMNLIIPRYSVDKNIKIWITGYSRGGAVANILASMYDKEKIQNPYQVYAYTFASPKTAVIESTKCHDTIYRNIFNILSPNDPVYNIPPQKWGFGRFGICVVFPDNNRSENPDEKKILDLVYNDYRKRTGKTPITQESSVNSVVNLIIKSSESRDFFSNNLSKALSDLIVIKMSREKTDSDKWEKYSSDKILKIMYGEEIIDNINKLKTSYFFNSLKKIGIHLPDDFYLFVELCRINGYTGYESLIFTKLNIDEVSGLTHIASSDFIYVGHTTPFYLSWLTNVPISELNFVKD